MTGGLCLLLWLAVLVSSCSGFTAQASEQKSGKQQKDHEFCVVLQTGVASRQLAVQAKGNKYIVRETQKKWHKHETTRLRLTWRWGWRLTRRWGWLLTWGEVDFWVGIMPGDWPVFFYLCTHIPAFFSVVPMATDESTELGVAVHPYNICTWEVGMGR